MTERHLTDCALSDLGLAPAARLPVARELGETSLMFLVHPTLGNDDMLHMASGLNWIEDYGSIDSSIVKMVFEPDTLEFAVLDDAQDLLLGAERNGRQLVKHQRAAIGAFEMSDVRLVRTREGARFVAKKFGFQYRFRQSRAIHLDDPLLPAIRQVMQA